MKPVSTVAITGSSGLVGRALRARLGASGIRVVPLVRGVPAHQEERTWSRAGCDLTGVDAVVHLAGESIASGPWTSARRRRILESRVEGTQAIAHACRERQVRLISASAVGYYGDRAEEELDESARPGRGFLAEVCQAWEEAARAAGPGSASLRFGQILSWQGGSLALQARLYRLFLGARLGTGAQWMPWISLDDAVGAVGHLLDHPGSGAFNAVSLVPARQRELHDALCRRLGRPRFPTAPAWVVGLLPGGFGNELLLSSAKVAPRRLEAEGFAWRHPDLGSLFGE